MVRTLVTTVYAQYREWSNDNTLRRNSSWHWRTEQTWMLLCPEQNTAAALLSTCPKTDESCCARPRPMSTFMGVKSTFDEIKYDNLIEIITAFLHSNKWQEFCEWLSNHATMPLHGSLALWPDDFDDRYSGELPSTRYDSKKAVRSVPSSHIVRIEPIRMSAFLRLLNWNEMI